MRSNAYFAEAYPTLFCHLRYLMVSIGLCAVVFLFHERAFADQTVHAKARFTDSPELSEVRRDLAKIDQDAANGIYDDASAIVGKDIKARDIYRRYIQRASSISEQLLSLRPRLTQNNQTMSLQQLGAFAQNLSAENQRFAGTFTHGEENFQTYQLIQTAITNLEDAINYWRISNRYRNLYRGSQKEQDQDQQILRLKIQTALNAIDQLKTIIQTREALSKDLAESQSQAAIDDINARSSHNATQQQPSPKR
jgi:hypothetical protein